MRYLMTVLICCVALTAHSTIYKWTDSKGNVSFGDTPQKGATVVDIPEAQTFPSSAIEPIQNTQTQTSQSSQGSEDQGYQTISITQPEDGATLRDNQGNVPVVVTTDPSLRDGDKFRLLYDGDAIGEPQSQPSFMLTNVLRGSHMLMVEVLNASGEVVGKSESITIYMHRARVGMGRNSGGGRGR